MTLLVLSKDIVESLLDVRTAIRLVDDAMRALSRGTTAHLVRRIMPLPGESGGLGEMPGSLGRGAPFGLKCIAGFQSPAPGQSSHRGAVLLFAPENGEPVALLEAGVLTAIRTAAASACATNYLARKDVTVLGLLGAGEQALWHVPALLSIRPFQRVLVWARDPSRSARFAQDMTEKHGTRCEAVPNAIDAAGADVVCTLTSSPEPVLRGDWIRPGTHINLVGSSSYSQCEADVQCVAMSRYFVDWEESARAQASELQHALAAGVVSNAHILGEIGAVADGRLPGRLADTDVTVYKSLGVIVQDLICGWFVYQQALERKLGQTADF